NVDRYEDHTAFDARKKKLDRLHTIREMHAQPLAAPHTTRRQHAYQPVAVILDVAERARLAPAVASNEFQRRFAAAVEKREVKQMQEVHATVKNSEQPLVHTRGSVTV